MTHSHKVVSGVDIVYVEEALDLYSAPDIKKFCRSLTHSGNPKILLVLANVHFMDSSGFGMLSNLYFECKQKRIPLKIANLSTEAKRMFALTKLDKSFNVYNTEEEAILDFL